MRATPNNYIYCTIVVDKDQSTSIQSIILKQQRGGGLLLLTDLQEEANCVITAAEKTRWNNSGYAVISIDPAAYNGNIALIVVKMKAPQTGYARVDATNSTGTATVWATGSFIVE